MSEGGLPALLKKTAADARRLLQLQGQLVVDTVRTLARKKALYGAGAFGGAIFVVVGVLFLLASAAAGLAIVLPWWLALLTVGGGLIFGGALVAALSVRGFAGKSEPAQQRNEVFERRAG
jgi:putative superfamily III holin-X